MLNSFKLSFIKAKLFGHTIWNPHFHFVSIHIIYFLPHISYNNIGLSYLIGYKCSTFLTAVNFIFCFSSFVFGMAGHVSGKSILPHSTGLFPSFFLSSLPLTLKHRIKTGIRMEAYTLIHHNPYTHLECNQCSLSFT